MKTETKPADIRLDEAFFDKFFNVQLGEKPADQCSDEKIMSVAISTFWARMVEAQFQAKLWLSRYIKTSGMPAIAEKTGLIRNPGDTLTINRLNLLTADGHLSTTHTLSGQEEQLSPSVMSLSPSRYGNAVCWPHAMPKKVPYELKVAAKDLLGIWAAQRLEQLLLTTAVAGVAAANIIYAGTATSVGTITATDILTADEIRRSWAILSGGNSPSVDGSAGSYIAITHPWCLSDLFADPEWQVAVRWQKEQARGAGSPFTGNFGVWMAVQMMSSTLIASQTTAASPGVDYYETLVLGARALGLAYGLQGQAKMRWLTKVSDWQEQEGVGVDFFTDVGVLQQPSIVVIRSAATNPR